MPIPKRCGSSKATQKGSCVATHPGVRSGHEGGSGHPRHHFYSRACTGVVTCTCSQSPQFLLQDISIYPSWRAFCNFHTSVSCIKFCFNSILVYLAHSPRHLFSPRLISQARRLSRPLYVSRRCYLAPSGISENAIGYEMSLPTNQNCR